MTILDKPEVWDFIYEHTDDIFRMTNTQLNQLTNNLEKNLGRAMKTPGGNIAKNRNDSSVVKVWSLYWRRIL
jgi:hypothetical protein